MSLDSLTYLIEIYWPYMAGVMVVGLAAGWFGFSRPTNSKAAEN